MPPPLHSVPPPIPHCIRQSAAELYTEYVRFASTRHGRVQLESDYYGTIGGLLRTYLEIRHDITVHEQYTDSRRQQADWSVFHNGILVLIVEAKREGFSFAQGMKNRENAFDQLTRYATTAALDGIALGPSGTDVHLLAIVGLEFTPGLMTDYTVTWSPPATLWYGGEERLKQLLADLANQIWDECS